MTFSEKLIALRQLIKHHGGGAFVVPRQDLYQGEYVAPWDERLHWLTGFTGSAGYALITLGDAALYVDGRYTLQARQQVDQSLFKVCQVGEDDPSAWLFSQLNQGPLGQKTLLYDPWLHTPLQVKKWQKICGEIGLAVNPVSENLIDRLWTNRPACTQNLLQWHGEEYAGEPYESKKQKLEKKLESEGADALILTSPESICWLYNIRGQDLEFVPTAHMVAIIYKGGKSQWFLDPLKVHPSMANALGPTLDILPFEDILLIIESLRQKRVWLDPAQVPIALYQALLPDNCILKEDPCILPRAMKNETEQWGARRAHIKDGLAVTRFLAWLDQHSLEQKLTLTELDLADRLEAFRCENDGFRGLSFPTIAGSGSHGAIIHYKPVPETSKRLEPNNLFLLDSGAHYNEGTTDVTRTFSVGKPSPEHKDRFTRVLKGHIALASAVFPKGTTGHQLDVLARLPLWQQGLDYEHGTGHGVGSFLNVHEGPQRIGKGASGSPLHAGMILSNEPGYYKTDEYGIRIENLMLVCLGEEQKFHDRQMMVFETLTLIPLDRTLIEKSLLSDDDIAWVNDYHQRVCDILSPLLEPLDSVALRWLTAATLKL